MASFSDNFNRADGDSLGASWTEDEGDIDILTNRAVSAGVGVFNRARYTGTQFDSANHYTQALGGGQGGTDMIGVSCRQASATNTCYVAVWVEDGATGLKLRSIVAGTETELGSGSATGVVDRTIKVQANGTTISAHVDGTQVVSVTDTSISSGTYGGLHIFGTNGRWDDFAGADLAAATGQGHLLSNKRNRSIQ